MVTSKKETGGIPVPTISIAAWNPRTKNGWKGNASMRYDLIGAYCRDEARPVVDCIEENTFRQSEMSFWVSLLRNPYGTKKTL